MYFQIISPFKGQVFFSDGHDLFVRQQGIRKSHVLAVDNICGSLKGGVQTNFPGFVSMVTASDVDSSLSAILLEY